MSAVASWDVPQYQRIKSAEYQDGRLLVHFEDDTEVIVEAARLLPPHSHEADWAKMTVDAYEIGVPSADGDIEIPWSTIRVLTDRNYSAHLATAAEEQARQIGQRIHELRRSRGLSGKELAARAGISAQSLSRIENGRHDVVLTTLQRILTAMGYSLRDLTVRTPNIAIEPDAATDMSVLTRLAEAGVEKEFVERRLMRPITRAAGDGHSLSDRLLGVVEQMFGWSPADVYSGTPLRFDPVIARAARFKTPGRANQLRKATYTVYAYYLARLVLNATPELQPLPIPESAEAVRGSVIKQYGSFTFENLLRFTWDLGIPVLPLLDSGAFHGACWRDQGRSVIVLKHVTTAHAIWLFDLGHELYHIANHLSGTQSSIIESEEIAPGREADSDEEWEASNFAGSLILQGRAEELVKKSVQAAGGSVERLKTAVQRVAAEEHVPLDALANYLAFRLSLQGINWWGGANRFQITDPPPWKIARDILLERAQLGHLSPLDRELLLGAWDDTEEK